jgi:hypothetical protein
VHHITSAPQQGPWQARQASWQGACCPRGKPAMSKAEERGDGKSDAEGIHAPPAAMAWSGLVWPDYCASMGACNGYTPV